MYTHAHRLIYTCSMRSGAATQRPSARLTHQHPSAPAIVVLRGGVSPSCDSGLPLMSLPHGLRYKEVHGSPSNAHQCYKVLHWPFGCEAIFYSWRSLGLLALSLFNTVLPALVGNPPLVVPVSLHFVFHNETKPGTVHRCQRIHFLT